MKPLATPFEPVGVARSYAELQPFLRQIADESGMSREEIGRRARLPDGFVAKALAPMPVGTCQLGAKTLEKMLRELGAVLIVARVTPGLNRAADSAVKRREEQVRVKLLSTDVWTAAKHRLAKENGRKGGKARMFKMTRKQRQKIARRGGRNRWRKHRLAALKCPKLMEQVQLPPRGAA